MNEPVLAEIAISREASLKGVLFRLGIFGPLIIAQAVLATDDNSLPPWVFLTIIGLGLAIGGIAVGLMVRRVQVTASGLQIVRFLGARTIRRDQLVGGIYARKYYQPMAEGSSHLIVFGHNNKRLTTLNGQLFSEADLNQVAKAIGTLTTVETITDAVTPVDIAERHPGVLRLWERRPTLVGFLISGVIIVVVCVLVFTLME